MAQFSSHCMFGNRFFFFIICLQFISSSSTSVSVSWSNFILRACELLLMVQKSNERTRLFSDPKLLADYRAGFNQCANEVNRNILTSEGSDQLREKLLNHLASYCHGNATNRVATSHAPGIPAMTPSFPAVAPSAVWIPYPSPPPSPTSQSAAAVPVSPVKPELHCKPSPVSPSAAYALISTLSPASSPNATTKTPLWRPWWKSSKLCAEWTILKQHFNEFNEEWLVSRHFFNLPLRWKRKIIVHTFLEKFFLLWMRDWWYQI